MSANATAFDPNANLAEQRRIVERLRDGASYSSDPDRLAELVAALDGSLSDGGSPPTAWTTPINPDDRYANDLG